MTDDQERHNQSEPTQGPTGEDCSPEVALLREQLEAARAERDEQRNAALRNLAELDNYRKRVNREREEDARYRALPLAKDVLPALDNLRRAVQAASQSGNADELIRGVEMVLRQFDEALARHDVKPIGAEGQKFDPNRHDALTQVPSPHHEPMTVLQEVERGYTLHDRVLRPSKVIVAAPPPG